MMHKLVYMFPGQGSQKPGMGRDLYNSSRAVKDIYSKAEAVLGYNLAEICFTDALANPKNNIYVQPAVFVTNHASLCALEDHCSDAGLKPSFVLGHSLGEYNALVASHAMAFEDALKLVQKRAELWEQSINGHAKVKMIAIVGHKESEYAKLAELCQQMGVYIALLNCKSQTVIGGSNEGVDSLIAILKKEGIGRVHDIPVVGALHTPYMQETADLFRPEIDQAMLKSPEVPIIANVPASPITSVSQIRQELYDQVFSTVDWHGSMQYAIRGGANLFIELGPNHILAGFLRRDHPKAQVLNIDDRASLDRAIKQLSV